MLDHARAVQVACLGAECGRTHAHAARVGPLHAKHGTFNFLLSNGQALWAHASTHLHYVLRQYPFKTATLKDEDMQVNFADQTNPGDRVAVVVTAPLTLDEPWTAFEPGKVMVFRDGALL